MPSRLQAASFVENYIYGGVFEPVAAAFILTVLFEDNEGDHT